MTAIDREARTVSFGSGDVMEYEVPPPRLVEGGYAA